MRQGVLYPSRVSLGIDGPSLFVRWWDGGRGIGTNPNLATRFFKTLSGFVITASWHARRANNVDVWLDHKRAVSVIPNDGQGEPNCDYDIFLIGFGHTTPLLRLLLSKVYYY